MRHNTFEPTVWCNFEWSPDIFSFSCRSDPVLAGVNVSLNAFTTVTLPESIQTAEQILEQYQPLRIVLLRTFPHANPGNEDKAPPDLTRANLESEVLGTAFYDWREVCQNNFTLSQTCL